MKFSPELESQINMACWKKWLLRLYLNSVVMDTALVSATTQKKDALLVSIVVMSADINCWPRANKMTGRENNVK